MQQGQATARVLVVEDEALIARDIESRLQNAGYVVPAIIDTGEGAVRAAGQLAPDLVLMDIRLKGDMDGVEAAEAIHRLYDIPVVYLTAHADRGTLDRAKLAAPFGYVTKPLGSTTLPGTIEVALYKHQLERQLREREAWLATTLRSVDQAVAVTDALGQVLFLNPEAERITGITQAEASGKPLDGVVAIWDKSGDRQLENLVPLVILQGSTIPIPRDATLAGPGDSRVPIEGTVSLSRDGEKVVGAVMVFRDVTVQRKRDTRLLNEHKMAAVSRLSAGIANDFGLWIAVIGGCVEQLLNQAPQGPSREPLLVIRRINQTAKDMLRSLLSFSRREPTFEERIDLNVIVQAITEQLKPAIASSIRIEQQLSSEPAWIRSGFEQVEQVVSSLMRNANEAMPAGGVLRISTDFMEMSPPSGGAPYAFVRLKVEDTGVGMDREMAEHLFEPFFTTKQPGWGVGLGLPSVHRAVVDLGGYVDVDSVPGQGTTVTVCLPLSEVTTRNPGPAPAVVLMVESHGGVRSLVQSYFEQNRLYVLTAEDGAEALALAEVYDKSIDVIVADQAALGENYAAILGELSSLQPAARILLLQAGRAPFSEAPTTPYPTLYRPFSKKELLDKVREVVPKIEETPGTPLQAV